MDAVLIAKITVLFKKHRTLLQARPSPKEQVASATLPA
jgi:hypothetical protein